MSDTQHSETWRPGSDLPEPRADTGDLVRRAKDGDESALEDLFSVHHERLQRYVRKHLGAELRGQQEDSEDILHSAYRGALKALPDFQPEGDEAWIRWLGTIVANKIASRARYHRAMKRGDGQQRIGGTEGMGLIRAAASKSDSPLAGAEAREEEDMLYDALELMPPDRRKLLISAHISKQSLAEIALELGCSKEAARHRILRAEDALKRVLQKLRKSES